MAECVQNATHDVLVCFTRQNVIYEFKNCLGIERITKYAVLETPGRGSHDSLTLRKRVLKQAAGSTLKLVGCRVAYKFGSRLLGLES